MTINLAAIEFNGGLPELIVTKINDERIRMIAYQFHKGFMS